VLPSQNSPISTPESTGVAEDKSQQSSQEEARSTAIKPARNAELQVAEVEVLGQSDPLVRTYCFNGGRGDGIERCVY
jgi:hypothetical protein